MNKALLAALLMAIPGLALAQSQPSANQGDPQVQANERMQPLNAQPVERGAGLGQANTMPTPALQQPMTPVQNQRTIPHSDPIR